MPDTRTGGWPRLERIYHDALALPAQERSAFVNGACGDDASLRREIESLLRYESLADTFLERPALADIASVMADEPVPDLTGRRFGDYEVLGLVGSGGMGHVYAAKDTRLGREAALKILSRSVSADPLYVRRFEEEARSASVLSHPNIVTIYGVGEHEGIAYIAMEMVRGKTLRQVMADGALALAQSLDISVQLADALSAAHGAGIVHRDLKPENIMMTTDGRLKVLDFGIARRSPMSSDGPDHSRTGTTTGLTEVGTIIGTVGYMSPEQALGKVAGFPSDQFAFGAIVYELLSGRRAFQRDTRAATISAIVESTPEPLERVRPDAPKALRVVLDRCLEKRPEARFHDTRDLDVALREIRDDLGAPAMTRRRAMWLGAGAAAGAITIGAAWRYWPTVEPASIAVLPFANRSNDQSLDYLSDGITASVIEQVAKLPVHVMPRSLVFNFKSSTDPVSVGKKLNADHILTGTIARNSAGLVLSVELRDVRTGALQWTKTYEDTADLMAIQSAITTALAETLRLRVTDRDRERLSRRPTTDPVAYDLFMRGRYVQMRESEWDYLDARRLFEKAIARDPRFAEAHVALAGTYWTSVIDNYIRPIDAWPKVDTHIRRAMTINPQLAVAHVGIGNRAFFFDWDWQGAEVEYELAAKTEDVNLQPELLLPYAFERWAMNRADEAVRHLQRARKIDGVSPVFLLFEGRYRYHARQFDEAAALFLQGMSAHPRTDQFCFGLADVRSAQGRFHEALEARKLAHELAGDDVLRHVLTTANGERGYRAVERAAIQLVELPTLEQRDRSGLYAAPLDFARAYAQLGDYAKARDYLSKARDEHAAGLVFLNVDRAWDAVRGDSWFKEAVQAVDLPA